MSIDNLLPIVIKRHADDNTNIHLIFMVIIVLGYRYDII